MDSRAEKIIEAENRGVNWNGQETKSVCEQVTSTV